MQHAWLRTSAHGHMVEFRTHSRSHSRRIPAISSLSPEKQPDAPCRRIIMLRHGQSVEEKNIVDHQRPLTSDGRAGVARVARAMRQKGWIPDLILCSDTVRSRESIEVLCQSVEAFGEVRTRFLGTLYVAAAMDDETRKRLKDEILQAVGDAATTLCVMCVGHNKGWEEAASQLSGQPVKLEPGSAAVLEVAAEQSWEEALGDGRLWALRGIVNP